MKGLFGAQGPHKTSLSILPAAQPGTRAADRSCHLLAHVAPRPPHRQRSGSSSRFLLPAALLPLPKPECGSIILWTGLRRAGSAAGLAPTSPHPPGLGAAAGTGRPTGGVASPPPPVVGGCSLPYPHTRRPRSSSLPVACRLQ